MHYQQLAEELADLHNHPLDQAVMDVFAICREHRLHPARLDPAHADLIRTEYPDRADAINRILHRA